MKNSIKSKLLTTGMALFALCAFADPATGWKQTGAGPYDYNDTANWVNGDINGIFGSDLTLTAAQTITFAADTTLPDGLQFNHGGAFKITMKSADSNTYTLTLGGDIVNNAADTKGYVEPEETLNIDLGGATRTISTTKSITLIHGVISNGGIITAGAGELRFYGANTYADGTYLSSSGPVGFINATAFGTGTVRFCDGARLMNTKGITMTANNPLVFEGDFSYSSSYNVNLGAGSITIQKPCTFSISNGYTVGLGGQIDPNSPCDITAITKTGGGSLSSASTIVLSNGEEKTLNVSGGNFYFSGSIMGDGTFVKAGGGYLELSGESNPFEGTFVIKAGSVRHKYAKSLPSNAKFLILDTGVLRSNASKEGGYKKASDLLPLVDTASTGFLGISSDESGDMDLTAYPNLIISPSGNTFTYSGNITAPSTGILKIGGGGKTLKLSGTISGATEIDASTGSIQFNTSQPDFAGTITCGSGFTLLVGSSAELSTADLVSNGGTIRFAAASEGEFVRARSVTLNTAQLTIDSPSAGAVSHRISGALKTGVYEKSNGGTSRVTMTNSGANDSTLSVGSMSNVKGAEMLNIVYDTTATGASKLFVESAPAMVGTGALGTIYTPVIPFVRVDNSPATYDPTAGVRALAAGEYTVYEAGYEGPVLHSGENLATTGNGTITLTGSASVNSIWMIGAQGADQTLQASEGSTISVASGVIHVKTYGNAKYDLPTDFGARRGFVSARAGIFYNLYGSFAGTGGLTIADMGTSLGSNGPNLYSSGNTFVGDAWVLCYCYPKTRDFFPHNEDLQDNSKRTGDLYLYGRMANSGVNQDLNALIGAGSLISSGSASETIYFGYGGTDGDFSGTVGESTVGKTNFGFVKEGSGKQRFSGTVGGKWNGTVNGGELQIDGTCNIGGRDGNGYHLVINSGVLSGCGTISAASTCGAIQIKANGVVAPGSAEIPNVAMKLGKNVEMTQGASMKFYIGDDRVSQAIVSAGYGLTGTATSIPVTVDYAASKAGTWMLLEADTFNGKTFTLTPKIQGGRLHVLTDDETNRAQLWFEKTVGLGIIIR